MRNQNPVQNPATFVKLNTVIHLALLAGQVLFGVVTFAITPNGVVNLRPGNDVFFYVAPAFVLVSMFLGGFLFKQQLSRLDKGAALQGKLTLYQTASIIRWAMSEGASLFCIVFALNTGNLYYLILAGVNIIYFIAIRPTKAKVEDALDLDYNEKAAI